MPHPTDAQLEDKVQEEDMDQDELPSSQQSQSNNTDATLKPAPNLQVTVGAPQQGPRQHFPPQPHPAHTPFGPQQPQQAHRGSTPLHVVQDVAWCRALIAWAQPMNCDMIDCAGEITIVEDLLRAHGIQFQVLHSPSRSRYVREIDAFRPHIVYFIGHGFAEAGVGLVYEQDRTVDPVAPQDFGFLTHRPWVHLAVLSCCNGLQTAQALATGPHGCIAVCAEIASTDQHCYTFAATFLQQLLSGCSIQHSVLAASQQRYKAAVPRGSTLFTQPFFPALAAQLGPVTAAPEVPAGGANADTAPDISALPNARRGISSNPYFQQTRGFCAFERAMQLGHTILALSASGGTGKTEALLQYAGRHGCEVLWFDAEDLSNQLADAAISLRLTAPEANTEHKHAAFCRHVAQRQNLIIAVEETDTVPLLVEATKLLLRHFSGGPKPACQVLLMSRLGQAVIEHEAKCFVLELTKPTVEQAVNYLMLRTPHYDGQEELDEKAAAMLADSCACLPLALECMATISRNTNRPLHQMQSQQLWNVRPCLGDCRRGYYESLARTFAAVWDCEPQVRRLLSLCAFFSAAPIHYSVFGQLVKHGVHLMPEGTETQEQVRTFVLRLHTAWNILRVGSDSATIHKDLVEALRTFLLAAQDDLRQAKIDVLTMLDLMFEAFDGKSNNDSSVWHGIARALRPHIGAILSLLLQAPEGVNFCTVSRLASYLSKMNCNALATECFTWCNQYSDQEYLNVRPGKRKTLLLQNSIWQAVFERRQGEYEAAEGRLAAAEQEFLLHQDVALSSATDGDVWRAHVAAVNSSVVMAEHRRLEAELYEAWAVVKVDMAMKDPERAVPLGEAALTMVEKAFDMFLQLEHTEAGYNVKLAHLHGSKGKAFWVMRDYTHALPEYEQALAACPEDHFRWGIYAACTATCLFKLDNDDPRALQLGQQARSFYEDRFGKEHRYFFWCGEELAEILLHRGQHQEAVDMLKEALNFKRCQYSPDHKELVLCEERLGRAEEAMALAQDGARKRLCRNLSSMDYSSAGGLSAGD